MCRSRATLVGSARLFPNWNSSRGYALAPRGFRSEFLKAITEYFMLIPAPIDMVGVYADSFDAVIQLWADEDETIPFPISDAYIVSQTELQVDGVATLTVGSGLEIDDILSPGTITLSMTPEQTSAVKPISKWRLKLFRINGIDSDCPAYGNITWNST
jgi:hypothetical protein